MKKHDISKQKERLPSVVGLGSPLKKCGDELFLFLGFLFGLFFLGFPASATSTRLAHFRTSCQFFRIQIHLTKAVFLSPLY